MWSHVGAQTGVGESVGSVGSESAGKTADADSPHADSVFRSNTTQYGIVLVSCLCEGAFDVLYPLFPIDSVVYDLVQGLGRVSIPKLAYLFGDESEMPHVA